MNKNTTRATAVVGATMALVLAGTAAVAAHSGDRDDRGPQLGGAGMGAWMGDELMPGARGMRGMLGGGLDDFERREVTVQTTEGTVTDRVEQGSVDSVADDSLSFSLASGETVSVAIDENTQLYAFEDQEVTTRGGWSRTRLAPTEIAAADVQAGAEVVVWSESEDGADFVASRIVVQPADVSADSSSDSAATEDTESDAADASTSDTVTEDAATDA